MKKFLSLLLVIFTTIVFVGCADASYSLAILDNGKVVEQFEVELQTQGLQGGGYDIDEIKTEVETAFNNAVDLSIANFESNMIIKFPEIQGGPTALLEFRNLILSSIEKEFTFDTQSGIITASLTFYDETKAYTGVEVFNNFYKQITSVDDETIEKTEDYVFVEKDSVEVTPYYYTLDVAENAGWIGYFIDYFDGLDGETANEKYAYDIYKDASFSYIYGTPQEKLYSDADAAYYLNGTTYHEWEIELEGYENENERDSIILFTINIIREWWYVLALALTVVFVITLYIVSLFKRKQILEDNEPVDIDIDISDIS